jgi:hypothetical protein
MNGLTQDNATTKRISIPDFDIAIIPAVNGESHVAVVYSGEYTRGTPTRIAMFNADTPNAKQTGEINEQNTCAILGKISAGLTYAVAIEDDDTARECRISIVEPSKNNLKFALMSASKVSLSDGVASEITADVAANTDAAVTYSAYSSSGTLLTTTASMFFAIDRARTSGTNATVKKDGTTLVYTHGTSGRYYKYQFTAYYGYTTSLTDVDNWNSNYYYTHVVMSSNARIHSNNYLMVKGSSPDSWALEPNSGGYYYQFGFASSSYPKVSKKVLLSQARLKPSQNSQPFNAYIFFTVQNSSISMDAGIYSGGGNGTWKICMSGGGTFTYGDTVCTSSLNGNGEYVASSDVIIEVIYTASTNNIKVNVKNVNTGQIYTLDRTNTAFGGTPATISSVSYVPGLATLAPDTPDYRCGGYLKNVIQTESKLYNSSGTAYDFYSTSAQTHYSLRYNSDCCEVTTGSSRDTIDIYYDKAYRT